MLKPHDAHLCHNFPCVTRTVVQTMRHLGPSPGVTNYTVTEALTQ